MTNGYSVYGYWLCQVLMVWLVAACHGASKPHDTPDASLRWDAGRSADAGEPHDTARALAMLEPTVAAESGENGPIALRGRADFWEHGPSVTLRLDIRDCKPGSMYLARVHAGADCSEQTLQGKAWPAGEDIRVFGCTPNGAFTSHYARRADHEQPWALRESSATNVVGHALTLSDAATGRPVTCGVITREPDAPFSETTDSEGPTTQVRGAIAGVCVFDRQVPKVKENCPDYGAAAACASTYCELNRCIDHCNAYVYCLAKPRETDVCSVAYTCEPGEACATCQAEVLRCETDLCLEALTCAEPASEGGPCSKLQACCTTDDPDSATCLDLTKKLARFGDLECQRLLDSWRSMGKPCPAD